MTTPKQPDWADEAAAKLVKEWIGDVNGTVGIYFEYTDEIAEALRKVRSETIETLRHSDLQNPNWPGGPDSMPAEHWASWLENKLNEHTFYTPPGLGDA